ncbi:MAG: exo-alpha-sialidase [Planctomycetes bacterium]|nr:exo-alpha-sialidase [Planctomycetota bacterium]
MKVTKKLYLESPQRGYAVILSASYHGPGLERRETLCYECHGRDDLPFDIRERFSADNGRTWSDWQPLPDVVRFEKGRIDLFSLGSAYQDPETGIDLGVGLRQTIVEKPHRLLYYNHNYWGLSGDGGKTWSDPIQFRYEEGDFRDANNPLAPSFLYTNRCYPGGLIRLRGGTLILCCTAVNVPKEVPDTDPTDEYTRLGRRAPFDKEPHARDIAAACFLGRWDGRRKTYDWEMSNRVWMPLSVSARGMQEGYPVELSDGRVLCVFRGSNTTVTPGRKWYSLSNDGGRTLSEIAELKYDDGTRFFSPSSFHGFIRHSVNGRLYWLANICQEPPEGNMPRHPLVIAEVDESIPAIKRKTVTIVDDRQSGEGKRVSLSNWSVFENRETHDFELYMSRYGAKPECYEEDPRGHYSADAYQYVIRV